MKMFDNIEYDYPVEKMQELKSQIRRMPLDSPDDFLESIRGHKNKHGHIRVLVPVGYKGDNFKFNYNGNICIMEVGINGEYIANHAGKKCDLIFYPSYKSFNSDNYEKPDKCVLEGVIESDKYYMFQEIKDLDEKAKGIKAFHGLTDHQKNYLEELINRPIIKEKERKKYEPIRSAAGVKLMYDLTKKTFNEETQKSLDYIYKQLDVTYEQKSKNDINNRLSCILGIDTAPKEYKQSDYYEIMKHFDMLVYGKRELKESIVEYLLASQYKKNTGFQILLIGKPGVGKTMFCQAIADVYNRPMASVNLNGANIVSIAGLPSSYASARYGAVINEFMTYGSTDLVLRLDELDKINKKCIDGNPYDLFIKMLGAEKKFYDYYIDADVDTSATKIIATANDKSEIPEYILNRFEGNIFYIDDYNAEDKFHIAKDYILPRKIKEYNLNNEKIIFSDKAINRIVEKCVDDPGVRKVEAMIEKTFMKTISLWSRGEADTSLEITEEFIDLYFREASHQRAVVGFTYV